MLTNGTLVGFDGSVVCCGDIVYCAEEKGIYQIDYWTGSHVLKYHTGIQSIAPTCITQDSESVLAHNLILLRGGVSHLDRMGPVAKTLVRLSRKWTQQRLENKGAEDEPEAKASRNGEPVTKRVRQCLD